jgi:KTSC domain
MVLIEVNSSAIAAVGYDGQNLYIEFQSGPKVYEYPNVPDYIFTGLIESSSPGAYYHENVHGKY